MNLDWGPDARARIVVDPMGHLVVTFGTFRDTHFNGRAYFARSSDGGETFSSAVDVDADRLFALVERERALLLGAIENIRDLPEPDQLSVSVGDDEALEQ